MPSPFILRENKARNRPMAKMPREQLERALGAHDRIQAESDRIRARAGLEPVPENALIVAARARLAAFDVKPSRRSARPKAPARVLTPAEQADDLARRRRQWKREGEAIDAEIAALAASGELGATRLGRALGVSRQRVYQLAAAA